MKFYIAFAILFFSIHAPAQQERSIRFAPMINDQVLELEKRYYSPELEDSIQFEVLRFYISDLQFFQDDKAVDALEKRHLLLDLESSKSLTIDLASKPNLTFNKIQFNIGVDSLTNIAGAMGGDLDPTLGMYWTWQSGYVNFKLEGLTPKCPARNNRFQFHIGGYQHPYNALQKVSLAISDDKNNIITVAIDQLLAAINFQETYQVMSPNKEAIVFAQFLPALFIPSK